MPVFITEFKFLGTSSEHLNTGGRWQRFQRYITSWRPLRIGAFGLVLVVAAFQWRQRSQQENPVAKKWEVKQICELCLNTQLAEC